MSRSGKLPGPSGAKARVSIDSVAARLNRLRKKSNSQLQFLKGSLRVNDLWHR